MSSEPRDYPPWDSSIEPAPGDLRVVQAFVNTLDVEDGTDELDLPAGLERWLRRWDLAGPGASIGEEELDLAVDLREGLRGLLLANGGQEVGDERARALERALAAHALRCVLEPEGEFALVATGDGWPRGAARMLTVVVRAMGDGSWPRLKCCRREGCRWAFYDSSKNRSGKWCSMERCGNLMKARAYRRRLAEASG